MFAVIGGAMGIGHGRLPGIGVSVNLYNRASKDRSLIEDPRIDLSGSMKDRNTQLSHKQPKEAIRKRIDNGNHSCYRSL